MKKITAFFMALLPIFVMVLLFAAGIIVKHSTHVYVQSVELPEKSLVVQKPDEEHDKSVTLSARVLPMNATNPELYWKSSDEDILTVDNQGKVACKKYGEAYVYAVSKENQTISSSCKIDINDKEIHNVVVSDEEKYNIGYIGLNERKRINTTIIPSTGVVDPTLVYKVQTGSEEYIDVTQDGLILPKKETGSATAKILISPATGSYTERATEVSVKIGPGVEQLCLENPTESITSSSTYNVFNQLNTYPEKKENLSPTDFIYTSDNEDVATIDENGLATFKKNDEAKFTATYKRNNSLSISKSVYSTCSSIMSVNFNCESYEQNIEYKDNQYVPTELDTSKIYCTVYPQISNNAKYKIVSTDSNVVLPERQSDGSYKFTALRPGSVMLYAYADETSSKKIADACCITVKSLDDNNQDLGLIKNKTVTLDKGMLYYPLINALNLQSDKRSPYVITYESQDEDIATVDGNGILHFKKLKPVVVDVKIDDNVTGTITVTPQDQTTELDVNNKIVINVGQKYKFKDGATVSFEGKSYEESFDPIDDGTWVAKNGCSIDDFEITLASGQSKTVNLIVKEDPIYIKNTQPTFFSTEETEYNYKKKESVSIVPSTALKEDGTKYNLSYSYELSNESIKVEDDNITFTDQGFVQVTTKCDDAKLSLDSWFKSSNGKFNKFTVKDANDEEVKSNQTVTYDGSQLVYTISNLSETEAEQFDIKIVSGSQLCKVNKEIKQQTLLFTYYVEFTIDVKEEAKSTLYGLETIAFTNGIHTVYLNVDVPATITNIEIMYGREKLSSSANITSYVKELELNIIPYPAIPSIVSTEGAYTATLDDTPLTITNNKVNIDLTDGTVLKIFAKDSTTPLKTYTFNYETDWSKLKISLIGADDNNVYMGCKETQKVLYLKANGLVPTNFFEDDKFTVELIGATHSEVSEIQQDILTIKNIPSPDGNEYSLDFKLKYDGTDINTFKLTRDIISKIVLPKHDNEDLTDKKGLQRVHVYGNRSYYDPTEKTIEGYRLPIEIYDYKGDEIVNTKETPDLKAKAIKSLVCSIDKNSSATYDEKNDCMLIKFANDTLYTEQEIAQNLFDSKNGAKNVTFKIATKSNAANAKYTFVPVEGINVYCQEGLKECDNSGAEHGQATAVLQTNFGIPGLEKENTKFEIRLDCVCGIYGNGYTMNADYQVQHNDFYLGFHFAFNTIFEGCSDTYFTSIKSEMWHQLNIRNTEHYKNAYFMYCTYKNFSNGISFGVNDPQPTTIKNSLFFNNKVAALITSQESEDAYIENCVFFDCGGLPNMIAKGGLHFKGYVGIYNFHNKEAFKDIFGTDLQSLWPIAERTAKAANMTEIGADGRLYINFFMCSAMTNKLYFWNNKTQQYEQGEKGTPDAANFIAKFIDLKIPFTSMNACLWATYNKTVDPSSFSYYDEFDQDGKLRIDFLSNQIEKLLRVPTYF